MELIIPFMQGILMLASAAIAGFFLRFWRRTSDRLFLAFAASFALLALHWTMSAFAQASEAAPLIYIIRLLAFICLAAGIIEKNRKIARG